MSATEGDLLLGRFRLLRALGEIGASTTWLAEDGELGEQVVLRLLAPELASSQLGHQRLRQACREARRLNHPQIARVHDFHRQGELCFLSRAYVEGGATPPPGPELAPALGGLVDAVAYAHGLGVVHGDLKASKVLWDPSGVPHLADFRVAAELEAAARALGPPTDEDEPGEATPADDVHALGALLFELLSGAPVASDDPRRPGARLRGCGVDPALADVIEGMLAPSPADRPDAAQVRNAFAPGAAPIVATPVAPPSAARSAADDDVIIPVPVRAPAEALPPPIRPRPVTTSAGPKRGLMIAFGVLLFVLIGVVFYLPRLVGSGDAEEESAAPVAETAATEETAEETAPPASSADAKQLLAEVMALQETLVEKQVQVWAPGEFREVEELIADGEKKQIAGKTQRAAEILGRARDRLDVLEDRVPEVLGEAVAAGNTALELGDDEGAIGHFERALAIDPENAEAKTGLARAERLDEVVALVASGMRYEADGKLGEARKSYQSALEIDDASKRAREGFDRVDGQLKEARYARGMARATQALARGALAEAAREVDDALAARPGSAEAKALRARILARQRQGAIARHMGEGERAEQAGRWEEAIRAYRAALAVDAKLGSARSGLSRAETRGRIGGLLSGWVADPERLLDPKQRAQATQVIAEARGLPDGAEHFGTQASEVERLLAAFSRPVTVVFESDNETQVTIQRHQKLGAFTRREVALDPGTYVVMGIRRGYRDVRQTIKVTPGQALAPVNVRCSQPI